MKKLTCLLAAAALLLTAPALAQNQLPAVPGPGAPVTASPVVRVGYDSVTGLPCVVGKITTCQALNEQAAVPLGYQQLTSMSASTALTVPTGATVAYVQAEAQNARWRDDGTAPTASVGQLLTASTSSNVATVQVFVGTAELAALRFIQTTSGAILNVSYYK